MTQALLSGLRRTLLHWPMTVFLYAALLAPTLIFGAVSWTSLQVALERSVAARTALSDLDLNLFVDLYVHHREMFRGIAIAAVLIGAATTMIWIWLHAAMIAAASDDDGLGESLHRANELYPPFFRLWAISLVVQTGVVVGFYSLARTLLGWTAESPSEMTPYWIVGGCVLAAAVLLLVVVVIHDHARIHCATTDVEALAAYRWALQFCLRDERRAVLLAVVVLGCGLGVWGVYQSIAMLVPTTSAPGVMVSLLLGQGLILARAAGRFWYFAAATELQLAAAAESDDAPEGSGDLEGGETFG